MFLYFRVFSYYTGNFLSVLFGATPGDGPDGPVFSVRRRYIQFFIRNPKLQAELTNSFTEESQLLIVITGPDGKKINIRIA